jgi:hypothetical protein
MDWRFYVPLKFPGTDVAMPLRRRIRIILIIIPSKDWWSSPVPVSTYFAIRIDKDRDVPSIVRDATLQSNPLHN